MKVCIFHNQKMHVYLIGRIVKGYNINRGVKQGNALSCIIFIFIIFYVILSVTRSLNQLFPDT